MPDFSKLIQRVQGVYKLVRWSDGYVPVYLPFKEGQIEDGDGLGSAFERDKHYFQIRVNEMFLAHTREWFSKYDPIVFAATEFLYDRDTAMVPQVIGPNLLKKYERELPGGVRYINTPVSGLHPYVGDDVVLVVILYRARRVQHLRNLLNLVENVVGAFDVSTALRSYLSIANVVLDGLDAILGTGDTDPIVAVRHSIGTGERFEPGYYALIDASEASIDKERLWVRGGRLCVGDSLKTSIPYDEQDFVLFSIVQTDERDDVKKLPFFPIWQETQGLAIKPDTWAEAKTSFHALWRELLFSPDLTEPQKTKLKDTFRTGLERLRDQARDLEDMAVVTRGAAKVPDVEAEFRGLDEMLKGLD
jgi:hypothetical protein